MTEISSKMITPCIPIGSFKQHEALWGKALLLVGGSVVGILCGDKYASQGGPLAQVKGKHKTQIKLISKHHVCLSQPGAAKTK